MDFQNRAGGKTGGGGVASFSESNRDRRERLRQLALETIDLNKVGVRGPGSTRPGALLNILIFAGLNCGNYARLRLDQLN